MPRRTGPQPYDPQPLRPNVVRARPARARPTTGLTGMSRLPTRTAPPHGQNKAATGPVNAGPGPNGGRRKRQRGRGRIRRFFRLRTVRVILALIAVFCCWVAFSVGQALTAPGGGSTSAKLAEWARDHYLGPVVTFGEWISYNPPKTGGKPGFSLAAPGGSHAGQGLQAHARLRAEHPAASSPPRPARRCPARAPGGCWRRSRATRPSSAPSCGRARCTPPTWRASSRWTSGWSGSSCGRAPRTRARATGRPRRGSRRAPARACWPPSTAGSSWTRRAAASTSTARTRAPW